MPGLSSEGWSTNWSSHPYGVPEYTKTHSELDRPVVAFKMADSLARRYTGPKGYDDIGQLSAIENNNMSIYPLKLRPPPLKKKKESSEPQS